MPKLQLKIIIEHAHIKKVIDINKKILCIKKLAIRKIEVTLLFRKINYNKIQIIIIEKFYHS